MGMGTEYLIAIAIHAIGNINKWILSEVFVTVYVCGIKYKEK